MYTLNLDMYQTAAVAVVMLFAGTFLRKRLKFLETFCIPAPIVGGLIFAVFSCLLHVWGILDFTFDETLKKLCMVAFFTSVGFQANVKVLKSGGVSLLIYLVCVGALVSAQDFLAVGMASLLGVNPLLGLCTGSVSMTGGHGMSGAFGPVIEDFGLAGAATLATAAATFGLIAGSLMGGPLGQHLILKKNLPGTAAKSDRKPLLEEKEKLHRPMTMYASACYQLILAMGIGTVVSMVLSQTGLTFPAYIGALIVAAVMRNIGEFTGVFRAHIGEINEIGSICLSIFLGVAMITLKLWQLAELALPLVILLLGQTVLMFLFARYVFFNALGGDYDAAVIVAGTCGFGMGATPNAMANMQVLTEKFGPSVKAYILVPIMGGMLVDFINSIAITVFINFV